MSGVVYFEMRGEEGVYLRLREAEDEVLHEGEEGSTEGEDFNDDQEVMQLGSTGVAFSLEEGVLKGSY